MQKKTNHLVLTQRMQGIVSFCRPSQVVADVGCDHGQVAAALVMNKIAKKVIATDVSPDSLEKARQLCHSLAIQDQMECRLGDGLNPLSPGEADGIILAGMGAPLMIAILEAGKETAQSASYLVLSPNNYPHRLRRYLLENGYSISHEKIVLEGYFYPILQVERGDVQPYSEEELLLGRWKEPTPTLQAYVEHQLDVTERIIQQAKAGGSSAPKQENRRALLLSFYNHWFIGEGGKKHEAP